MKIQTFYNHQSQRIIKGMIKSKWTACNMKKPMKRMGTTKKSKSSTRCSWMRNRIWRWWDRWFQMMLRRPYHVRMGKWPVWNKSHLKMLMKKRLSMIKTKKPVMTTFGLEMMELLVWMMISLLKSWRSKFRTR